MIIGLSGKKQHGKDTVAKAIQYLMMKSTLLVRDLEIPFSEFYTWKTLNRNRTSGWETKQFAEKLKQIVCLLIGCTMEQLEDNTFKETELGEEWRVWFWTYYKLKTDTYNGRLGYLYHTEEEARQEGDKWFSVYGSCQLETYILTPRKLLQLLGTDCGRHIIHPNIWINATMSEYVRGSQEALEPHQRDFPNWIITDVRFPNEAKAIIDKGGVVIRVINFRVNSNDTHESETGLDGYHFDHLIANSGTIEDLIPQVKNVLTDLKLLQ